MKIGTEGPKTPFIKEDEMNNFLEKQGPCDDHLCQFAPSYGVQQMSTYLVFLATFLLCDSQPPMYHTIHVLFM